MSEEKDRLGDKLRDKERGEEDRYFAQLDREKIEALRRKRQALERPLGDCPRCGSQLVGRNHLGVTVDVCDSCHGVWLDNGELQALVERSSESWMSRWLRAVLGSGD